MEEKKEDSQFEYRKSEQEKRIERLIEESFLQEYLVHDSVTDISYDGTDLYIKDNKLGSFRPDKQPTYEKVYELGKQIANIQKREWTNSVPELNTELSFLRINYIHEAVSPSGCTLGLRVSYPRLVSDSIADFANEDVEKLVSALIQGETNVMLGGRTGSGKTEYQKLLVQYMDGYIVLIEDTMDSHIKVIYPDKHIKSYRTLLEPGRENLVTMADLIRTGLRNDPDWLIPAEVRGGEAYDLVKAALTDHATVSTLHVKGARRMVSRIISMAKETNDIDEMAFSRDVVSVLPICIYLMYEKTPTGIKRFVREIVEFTGVDETGVKYNYLYRLRRKKNKETGEVVETVETNALSDEIQENLEFRGLLDDVPACFK